MFSLKSGNWYEGEFRDNKFNGHGEFTWKNRKVYKGRWKDDLFHGKLETVWISEAKLLGTGTIVFPSKNTFEREFEDDKPVKGGPRQDPKLSLS